jgi:DNA helicase-2/ATP-dependent DNA helicase PcrA
MDLNALNKEQRIAAETLSGAVLILAGAGSGKTRAITYRIANLLTHGVPASEILAITFTNKAAREMRERVDSLAGSSAKSAWILTFHACCARMLRQDIDKLGYKRQFTIYDEDDTGAVIKDILKRRNLDDKLFPPKEIRAAISDAKNKTLSPSELLESVAGDKRKETIADIYKEYEKRLISSNALDFDDLLLRTLELLMQHPPVLQYYRNKFKYIHVDEYQDTNHAQYLFVKLLAAEHGNLCVVGDDDQSIYSWRGADITNILDFEKDFPNCKVIKLERNYRSTASILDAANQIIAHNSSRKDKTLWTEREDGDKVTLFRASDERAEAAWVCDRMQTLKSTGVPYGRIACLYRVNAQSRVLEEMLVRAGIPYRVFGGLKFYDRREVRDIIAYLRVLINPADDVSLRRIINTPRRSIGEATVSELARDASLNNYPIFTSLSEPHEALSSRAKKSIAEFSAQLNEAIATVDTLPLNDAVAYVIDKFELRALYEKGDSEDAHDRLANIDEFVGAVNEYAKMIDGATLEGYLENIALVTDTDTMQDEQKVVTLMTLHSAKGLEFGNVFLIGLEQGLFPSMRSIHDPSRLEEERRLCYVGFTRAMDRLYISYAQQRTMYNQTQHNTPSQFLSEIPERLLEDAVTVRNAPLSNPAVQSREAVRASRANRSSQAALPGRLGGAYPTGTPTGKIGIPGVTQGLSQAAARAFAEQSAAMRLFAPGDRVLHKKFGEGNVVELRGRGSDTRVLIEFAAYGIREFVSSLAPIVKVNES